MSSITIGGPDQSALNATMTALDTRIAAAVTDVQALVIGALQGVAATSEGMDAQPVGDGTISVDPSTSTSLTATITASIPMRKADGTLFTIKIER